MGGVLVRLVPAPHSHCVQPTIEPGGGSVVVGVTISLTSPFKEASVYFTTDDTCVLALGLSRTHRQPHAGSQSLRC